MHLEWSRKSPGGLLMDQEITVYEQADESIQVQILAQPRS